MVTDPENPELASSLPAKQFDEVVAKYQGLWTPRGQYHDIERIAMPAALNSLEALDEVCRPADFKQAAAQFTWRTAISYDGFHPRHWTLLTNKGLSIVSRFAGLCLAMDTMPSQLTSTLSVILPKATQGFRTVGLFPSFYRVLVK